jgi:hypothetical protein
MSFEITKELMQKEILWTYKNLAWNKELKEEREKEMRRREAAKAAMAAMAAKEAKAAEQEEKVRTEAVEKEKSQLNARIATLQKRLKRLQHEDAQKKQESTQAAKADTASMRSGKVSQRSRSSAQLSTTGLLAVDNSKHLNRANSIPDVNFHAASKATKPHFRYTIPWTSEQLGLDHRCQVGVAPDGSTISCSTRKRLLDEQGYRPW